jgi:hypothetical protein
MTFIPRSNVRPIAVGRQEKLALLPLLILSLGLLAGRAGVCVPEPPALNDAATVLAYSPTAETPVLLDAPEAAADDFTGTVDTGNDLSFSGAGAGESFTISYGSAAAVVNITFPVEAVPEATPLLACGLLLLPVGAGLAKALRRENRAA